MSLTRIKAANLTLYYIVAHVMFGCLWPVTD